jgi:hypothetical protein
MGACTRERFVPIEALHFFNAVWLLPTQLSRNIPACPFCSAPASWAKPSPNSLGKNQWGMAQPMHLVPIPRNGIPHRSAALHVFAHGSFEFGTNPYFHEPF